jgi:hypothetical protein
MFVSLKFHGFVFCRGGRVDPPPWRLQGKIGEGRPASNAGIAM